MVALSGNKEKKVAKKQLVDHISKRFIKGQKET